MYEKEPKVHPDLLGLENVMLIPHLASATTETRTAMADLAASNVLAVLSGRPPLTPAMSRGRDRSAARSSHAGPAVVERVMRTLAREIDGMELPAIEKISGEHAEDPFQILIGTHAVGAHAGRDDACGVDATVPRRAHAAKRWRR